MNFPLDWLKNTSNGSTRKEKLRRNEENLLYSAVSHHAFPVVLRVDHNSPITKRRMSPARAKMHHSTMDNYRVVVCHYKDYCYYKSFRRGKKNHSWSKALYICTSEDTCNQKEVTAASVACRKYGLQKWVKPSLKTGAPQTKLLLNRYVSRKEGKAEKDDVRTQAATRL